MKKFLVVLLILAVAGSLFAQELKFTGEVRSGISVIATDLEDSKVHIATFSPTGDYTWRFTLNGAYTNADGNAGFNFNLRSQADWNGNADASMNKTGWSTYAENARLWLKVLDNKVTFIGGKTDDAGALGTSGGVDTSLDVAAGRGLFTRIEPAPGLTLGVGLYPNLTLAASNELQYGNYRAGVAYTVPDTVTVVLIGAYDNANAPNAAYTPSSKPGADDYTLNYGTGQYTLKTSTPAVDGLNIAKAAVGFKVLALKDLGISTLILDASFVDIAGARKASSETTNKSTDGLEIKIGEKVTFASGDLEVGARFLQAFLLGERATDDASKDYYAPDLTFTLYGQYKINGGAIVPRLDAWLNMGTPVGGIAGNTVLTEVSKDVQFRNGWDGIPKGKYLKVENDFVGNAGVNPAVAFQIGASGNQYITIGDKIMFDLTKDAKDLFGKSLYNNFYVDYKVSF